MNRKFFIFGLFILVGIAPLITFCQEAHNSKPTPASIHNGALAMKDSLHLTEQQTADFESLNVRFIADLDKINQSTDPPLTKSNSKKDLFKKREEALKQLFNQGQYAQYQDMVDRRRKAAEQKRKQTIKPR